MENHTNKPTGNYLQVSLYDELDNTQNRIILNNFIGRKFYSAQELEKELSGYLYLHGAFLITCIVVTLYNPDEEVIQHMNFSELIEMRETEKTNLL